jgi:hypothetical protein
MPTNTTVFELHEVSYHYSGAPHQRQQVLRLNKSRPVVKSKGYRGSSEAALVHRLANNGDVAGGQLAVFQGAVRAGLAVEAPISESYGSSEQRGKTAHWPRPGGLR